MKDKLLIIGASGHGKVVADIAIKMNKWSTIAFLDDNEDIKSSLELEVLGKSNEVANYFDEYDIFIAIGNNNSRQKLLDGLEEVGASITTIIHPNAVLGKQTKISLGTVIMPGAIVNSGTTIGKGCIINTGATVDHDSIIGNYVHLSPGVHLAGNVKVNQKTWLGIGSVVSNNISITSECTIGAGAVVINDILVAGTYVGVPVRRV